MQPAPATLGGVIGVAGQLVAGRYRLVDQIGRGAMGIVWRGRDEFLDRDVAVKQVYLGPLASAADEHVSRERTLREARSAARLSHPAVVKVYDVACEDGSPWIIMELVPSRPLDLVIAEDGPLRPADAARLGQILLSALDAAHAAGVLHRDVKPSNVLITGDGRAILTDFGVAVVEGDPSLTQAGMVVGTPGFSSPERVRGFPATPASDLWSLGATLYAAVEGRGPFERAGGTSAIIAAVATEPAPRAPSAGPLAPVIDALLRADPARRPDAALAARMLADAAVAASAAETGGPAAVVPAPAAGLALSAVPSASRAPDAPTAPAPAAGSQLPPDAPALPDFLAAPAFAALKIPPRLTDDEAGDDAGHARLAPGAAASGPRANSPRKLAGGTRAGGGPASHLGAGGRFRISAVAAAVSLTAAGLVVWLSYAELPALFGSLGMDRVPGPVARPAGAAYRHAGPQGPATAPPGRRGLAGTRAGRRGRAPAAGRGVPHTRSWRTTRRYAPPVSAPGAAQGPGTHSPAPRPGRPVPAPPRGYHWQIVTPAIAGTTAGYRLAVPDGWQRGPAGLSTTFTAAAGSPALTVDLSPFASADPARQAASAEHLLRARDGNGYRRLDLRRSTFRGQPAAAWRYRDKPALGGGRVYVTEILFTLPTRAGPQSYAVSAAARAPLPGDGLPGLLQSELSTLVPLT
jgi:eukaryotic-like serine/threonine-protein kinase